MPLSIVSTEDSLGPSPEQKQEITQDIRRVQTQPPQSAQPLTVVKTESTKRVPLQKQPPKPGEPPKPILGTLASNATQAIGQALRRPWQSLGQAWNAVWHSPAEQVEQTLTSGRGYQQSLVDSGYDPQAAKVGATIFRGALDPWNITLAPGATARVLSLGGKAASVAVKLAEESGFTPRAASVVGRMSSGLMTSKLTGPVAQRTAQALSAVSEYTMNQLDKFHGVPPDVKRAVHVRNQEITSGVHDSLEHLNYFSPLSGGERALITHTVEGSALPEDLPEHLRPFHAEAERVGNATTEEALGSGVIDQAREHYVLHLYGPSDRAKILARAVEAPKGEPRVGSFTRPFPERQYRAEQIAANLEEGSALRSQVLPTKGLRGVTLRSNRQRVFPTIVDAQKSGLKPIEDIGALLAAKKLSISVAAANVRFYKKIAELGEPWAYRFSTELPDGYVSMRDILGSARASVKMEMQDLYLHPRIATIIRDLHKVSSESGLGRAMDLAGRVQTPLKQFVFGIPMVHGANVVRAANLDVGTLGLFNPKYWEGVNALAKDHHELGEITRRRLAAGGSMSSSIGRQVGDTLDEIIKGAKPAVEGNLVQKAAAIPGWLHGVGRDFVFGWLDGGGRNMAFLHGVGQGMSDEQAAKYADLIFNDYSKDKYGEVEKILNNTFFVYAWTRGRAKLFSALARSYLPGVSAEEAGLYRSAATRLAAMSIVLPHFWRSWIDHQTNGINAGRIPFGESQGTYPDGTPMPPKPVYIKPMGWYNDWAEVANDPVAFAFSRVNPMFRIVLGTAIKVAQAPGKGETMTNALKKAMGDEVLQTLQPFEPAGVSNLTKPGLPLSKRILPMIGVPLTGPPPNENPRVQIHDLIQQGLYQEAGQRAKEEGLSRIAIDQMILDIPFESRKEFFRGYSGRRF